MKTKCSFILKASLALVLTILMVLGSVSTVIAAVADVATGDDALPLAAKKGMDIAATGANADLASTGALSVAGYIYFIKPSDWTYASLMVGHSSYSSGYNMSNISGTNLYYVNQSAWSDSTEFAFFDVNNWGGENSTISHRAGYAAHSSTVNSSYAMNSGSTYLIATTANSPTYYSGGYSALNATLTVKTMLKSGSSYAETTTKCGTFSATNAKKLNGNGSSTSSTISQSNGTATLSTARTNTATVSQSAVSGYTFKGWKTSKDTTGSGLSTGDYSFTNSGSAATVYAYYEQEATTYTGISAAAKGSTDGSTFNTTLSGTPATISANSYTTGSSALNISAGTVSGYSFYKWVVTAGSGTIGSATTANTTFTPSASNTTVTAQYKKNYTIKDDTTDTHGTVTLDYTSRVAGQTYKATVTPKDGYKIKTLTVGGSAVSAAAGKTAAYTYNGTASGSNSTISVVATFEPITNLQLYIAGRFRVRPSAGSSSWTTTYASGSDWNATSTNIPFTYVSGTTYKVDTYASLKELSDKPTNNQDPWFFVYDKTNSKSWHPTTQSRELGTTTEYNLTTNTDTYNVRFNSSSDDSPVTIYFDYNTKRLWYTIPDLYDVTVGTATGGTVTASPARAEADTEITLTIAPTTGYQLKSITAKDSSNASVTLSGSGNTRTFTMPAKNVTVTPVFEKITWSGLTAVGKYSTTAKDDASYSNDFPTGSAPNITIAATSATQLDGVAVTAPATDPTGYVFAGWYTTTGSFTAPNDRETTFKPNAANAVAIAKYKKLFTVTSSVDSTGTGAGTVTTSKTSVEAGGSYTITATAKSGSAVESVKVNGIAKTATASQTISSVSADQTVVVKFKSNVHLKGKTAPIGDNWGDGFEMQSNPDGTEFTKVFNDVPGSSSGTEYQFKLYTNDWSNDGTATINITGGAGTGTCTHQSSGDQNYVLTLKQACNVTIKSDGTKITEIKVVPANATKYKVTFKKAENTTITGTYEGTNFTTASADAEVQVYSGDEISFTVTATSGKYLSGLTTSAGTLTPTFAAGDTYTGKISNVTSARTVTPTAANKLTVKAVTNKSARGTVSVNKSNAAPGESITVTVSPKNGVLKSLTATYANGAVYTCNLTSKVWTRTTDPIAGTSAAPASTGALETVFLNPLKSMFGDDTTDVAADDVLISSKSDLASTGASSDIAGVGADTTYPMILAESSAVTINATFDNYSGESTWYYNGYDTSGNALSGYHGKQMTESMVSGEKFSYYHVEGRSGTDQLMTVSDGVPSSGTRYVYFVRPNNYGDGWSASNNPKAHFWKNGGQDYDTWPGTEMSWQWNNDYGQGVYKIAIPDGADRVSFNDATGNGQHQTVDIDLTTTSGAYYVGEWNSSKYDYGTWDTGWADQGWVASGTEYFYQNSTYNGDYTGDFNTKGFDNHNTASKDFAKPKDLGTNSGDYYINVLYPNTTYTINGVTKKTGSNPMIIWSAEPLAGDDENVTIYAKDGSIRSESYGSTYANIADTKIYLNNETVGTKHSGHITNQTWETYKAAKGDTLVIKTQIGATDSSTLSDAADLKAKYYVRGFCVNGEVTELLDWNADGLYTLTYKVPEDDEDLKKIEITPIYYLKDTTANPIVTYRVTGFTDELKAVGTGKPNWGDTLYTYPFYGKLGSNNNALGAYPGQPMVYYKGQYQMQIPQKSTAWDIYYDDSALSGYSGNTAKANAVANTNVSGVTMSNGYYDIVHRSVMGYGDNSASSDHVQTYDYGDFFKIFNEKKLVDNIVFDFKYETKIHNFENQPAATTTKSTLDTNYGTNGNGFELLTNFHGRTVDLFGTPLSGDAADPSKTTPVYVVSIGGVNGSAGVDNIAGYYATEWMVYGSSDGSSYSRISANGKNSIPPEVLVLNDDDTTSFNTTTYPSAVTGKAVTDWKALYTALEAYRGKPVMISYEAADAQIGAGNYATSGGGGATRNDGRWLYSKNGENITSKIKIQYSDDNGATYTDLNTTTPQVDGLSAYFTNDGVEGQMTYSTTIDPDKTFDFEAKTTNGDYKFVGWYMEDGTKITSDNASHTERSGSYTFVAKFMQVQGGQLILSHSADKGTISGTDYQGAGTAKISAVVKDGEEVIRTYDLTTSDITLDDKIIKSDSSYTIDVTLEATATGNDTYGTTTLSNPSGQTSTYFSEKSSSIDGKTKTIVLNSFTVASLFSGTTQNVKNIIYHSYFTQAVFNYTLTFNYTDRFNASKSFTRQGTLTSAQAANENYVEKSGNNFSLLPAFIQTVAPHESNFGEDITWNINKASFTQSGSTYTCTATITANQTKDTTRNVTFKLPYQHSNGIATVNGDKVGTAATTTDFALTGNNAVAFDTIPVLLNDGVNGIYTEDEKKNWIAAPATLSDNGTTKYFQYWSVKSTSAAGENDPEVARCYFQGFNFVALDNYTVTPIYGVARVDITESGIYSGISFLETSRNQWNDNQTRQKGETDKASDLLYNDFVLNYNFNGAEIYKNGSDVSDIQELGVVVERVQELGIKQDGSKDTDISHYTSLATDTENVIAAANAEATDGQATYKVGTKPFYKQVVDKTSLDNKNRIMFYDAFYNGAGWNMEKQTSAAKYTYKNYVYRAYTYIKYNNGGNTVVKLADAPAYFTMYDEATATYAN